MRHSRLLAIIALSLTGIFLAGSTQTHSVSAISPRKAQFDSFMANAKKVVEASGNAEASKLFAFLQQYGQHQEVLPLEPPTFEPSRLPKFDIFCLQASDHVPWVQAMMNDELTVASFELGYQAIILRNGEQYSPIMQGVLLLHESKHAYTMLVETPQRACSMVSTKKASQYAHWLDEAATVHFQNQLLEEIGGQPYRTLLERVKGQLIELMSAKNSPRSYFDQTAQTGFSLGYPSLARPFFSQWDLDQIMAKLDQTKLGASTTDDDRALRLTFLGNAALFELVHTYAANEFRADAMLFYYRHLLGERLKLSEQVNRQTHPK